MPATRSYGGVSAEDRRTQRRAALIAAALDIVGTRGHARMTVGGLCAAAGLNERYFYESFATLDDVLLAVYDDVLGELTAAILTAVAGAPDDAGAKARAAIAAAVELLTGDGRKARVLFVEPLAAPVLNARRADVSRAFVGLVVGQAHDFYGTAAALRVGSWADLAAAYLVGGFAETMAAWLRGELAVSRAELIERSTELFVLVAEHVVGRARPDTTVPDARRGVSGTAGR